MSPVPKLLSRYAAVVAVGLLAAPPAPALVDVHRVGIRHQLDRVNRQLAGRVVDFTNNHGCDRRLASAALGERRDVYVYLPPGYDGATPFPAVLWLHGIGQDEKNFLDLAPVFDAGIRAGTMPPVVIAAPDGSIRGRPSLFNTGSFFLNSRAGRFEDFAAGEVWGYLAANFRVRPEREAHVVAGASMGGMAAYNLGFKHRDRFGQIAGFMPGLNLRYLDCHGRYFADYHPDCVGWRTEFNRNQVIGRFAGVIVVRERRVLGPLVDYRRDDVGAFITRENPLELFLNLDIQPGEFGLFAGSGTEDEFNVDSHVRQFADVAAARGVAVETVLVPGKHRVETGLKMVPAFSRWLSDRLRPFVPPGYPGSGAGPPVELAPAVPPPPAAVPTLP